jgi:AcrR family transcriptional regulator
VDAEELLWSAPSTPRRGPRPALSRDGIVRAGIQIADGDGLAALSMQRVAARLGAATMSLYRHVPGKNELVSLMLEAAIGEPPALAEDAGWRAAMAEWARGTRDIFVRHPWTLPLVTSARAMGPNELAWTESALRVLATTGLPGPTLLDVLLLVNGYVRGAAADFTGGPRVPGRDRLLRFGRLDRYPVFATMFREAGAADTPSSEVARFEFGLARVLDGVELFVRAHGDPAGPA